MYVLSMDKNGHIEFKKVLKVMRHYVRKPLYEIILASGRKIKVTGDHSLFALSSNLKIEPIKVSNLRVGDRIAVPRKIKLDESIREINLLERLQNTKNLFVGGEPIKEFLESKEGRRFLIEKIPTRLRSKRRFYRLKGISWKNKATNNS
jgi:intein/homing endonuclease